MAIETEAARLFDEKNSATKSMVDAIRADDVQGIETSRQQLTGLIQQEQQLQSEVVGLIKTVNPAAETKSSDYIFITFITDFLPAGLIGLLLAVIFSGAMSSTSAELNALASTSVVDFYQRKIDPKASDRKLLRASRLFTLGWGLLAVWFAHMASLFENLIELVNILGSLFYGTILGIFLVAIFFKKVKGSAVFIAAIFAEAVIISLFLLDKYEVYKMAYLWYNLLGPAVVIAVSLLLQWLLPKKPVLE
jgi:solute:Na+ symporter, SSS family